MDHKRDEENGLDGNYNSVVETEHMKEKEKEKENQEEEEEMSVERLFEGKEVPSWREQLTVRAFVVRFVLSVLFTFIVMKLNLTTGIIPSLNVSAGLLGFFFVSVWTKFLDKSGLLKQPFTRQENTVIQTCVVASSGIAFSGGFGSYLFGMSQAIAKQSENAGGNEEYKNPAVAWMIGFLFVVSFLGLFSVVPLRKIMIVDFKLTYPSGTATAHLINSFHTPQGAKLAKKQVRVLGKYFSFSFLWGFFQWFFAAGDDCGFAGFPTFGLKAYKYKFFFDFSATYVGVGMICPHIVNISLLVGGILSWGLMWPLIETRKGDWYPADLPSSNIRGLQGYKIFIAIATILGDGLYNFFKVLGQTLLGLFYQLQYKNMSGVPPIEDRSSPRSSSTCYNDTRRTQVFLKDQIPTSFAIGGYIAIAAISMATLPHIFPQLKWYYILVIYLVAPTMAFCNAYGCGLTDWSLASTYGKLAIFSIGAWAGAAHGGVIAGLAACGVMMNIASTASDLMQDFKTGYLTLASPRSMFVSQFIGTAMGCVISPCVFWLFYKAFDDLGQSGSEYPAPYALVFRNMAVLGVEGISNLPKNCFTLCCVFFGAAILVNLVRDTVGRKRAQFIPIPMAMAIPFYLGPYFAIDMCVGSLILFIWQRINKAKAEAFGPAVASGLICGDGLWTLPSSILALAGIKQPICMKFLSRATNARVDKFLGA
ncbi:probable metal-nicotianamine transporter YSL7 [Vitis vinifera]|uniref:Metal-nicotianamine transporter YSL7 n=1 Tax=Vitis vinifera TaxID=29760 RepID=F6HVR0_VITVI|nr:probable metal-nicotianamine transporter YSL7 [Vitis vinifera]|eukprot:XP_002269277.1 PREDICTED: probable metal-nicotianamine transporter YSL7 isoform X1 [Vitis vinifera]